MKKNILLLMLATSFSYAGFAQVADSTQRHIVLQGAANFRDLGGYKTKDGREVKWGKVYRSADISKLTDADLQVLKDKHIATDVDFRGHQESAAAPDRMNPNTDYILCPAGSDSLNNSMMKGMMGHKANGDSLITSFYINTKYLKDRYKPFFDKLINLPDDQSLLFHCTAGKDRTGIGAALFLYSLGVPYNTIVDDYTATNYYRKDENVKAIAGMTKMMNINPDAAKAMMSAKKEYLDATFAAIKQQYGSVDNFLRTQIGLTNQDYKTLKAKYLQ
ncbi:tyrosine-protein phosphatase [Mucilaginibacter jinjuensis]|uniref:Tyrosine-protein phosphatase n=1 Tax=Mucilaginibacter jinjuensis TaxID=1176721 RepID=A0ABY7TDN3_9SPHI|nr:tyrosine-protein phosphatase [Mucilaginibacter jinjuensis]WCT14624.1 tyrosine-protein phosphatase [Mucilaginibacter jinjuensis]